MDKGQPLYWISGWEFEGDFNFCREHAENKIKELKKENPEKEFFLDGGWLTEHDYPPYCETCQTDMEYSPTDYCLRNYPESKERA